MRVTIFGDARGAALNAIAMTDKLIDRVRNDLDELQVESLVLQALQGRLDEQRKELLDPDCSEFEWTLDQRRALALALLQLKAKVNRVRDSGVKITVDPASANARLNTITDLLTELTGQEKLFTGDTSWSDPKPAKGTAEDAQLDLEQRSESKLDATIRKSIAFFDAEVNGEHVDPNEDSITIARGKRMVTTSPKKLRATLDKIAAPKPGRGKNQ